MTAPASQSRINKMHEIIDHLEAAARLSHTIAASTITEYIEPAIETAKEALATALVEHSRREWTNRPLSET